MKTLYDFPKEIIIKMLIDVNNVRKLSDEELAEKIKVLNEEQERREKEKKLTEFRRALLEMYDFKNTYGIPLQNYEKLLSDISEINIDRLEIGNKVFALIHDDLQNYYYTLPPIWPIDLDLKSFQKFLNDRVPELKDFNRLTYILRRKLKLGKDISNK